MTYIQFKQKYLDSFVYLQFRFRAEKLLEAGVKNFSARAIIGSIQFDFAFDKRIIKISNGDIKWFSKMAIEDYPHLSKLFKTKK